MVNLVSLALPIATSILYAIIVLVIGLFVIKWITKIIGDMLDKKKVDPTLKPYIKSISSVLLKLLLIVAIIGILGIETSTLR